MSEQQRQLCNAAEKWDETKVLRSMDKSMKSARRASMNIIGMWSWRCCCVLGSKGLVWKDATAFGSLATTACGNCHNVLVEQGAQLESKTNAGWTPLIQRLLFFK